MCRLRFSQTNFTTCCICCQLFYTRNINLYRGGVQKNRLLAYGLLPFLNWHEFHFTIFGRDLDRLAARDVTFQQAYR